MKKMLLALALFAPAALVARGHQAGSIGLVCQETPDMQGGSLWTRANTTPPSNDQPHPPTYFVCGYIRKVTDLTGTVTWTANVTGSDNSITKTTMEAATEWLKAQAVVY